MQMFEKHGQEIKDKQGLKEKSGKEYAAKQVKALSQCERVIISKNRLFKTRY